MIQILKKKLYWYTYAADEKDFDYEEVQAISKLLNVIDPIKEGKLSDPEGSYDKFKERYQIKSNTKLKYKKILMGAAALFSVIIILNIGSYASSNKSFFQIMIDKINGVQLETTGESRELAFKNATESVYEAWKDIDVTYKESILIPSFIPADMELYKITTQETENVNMLIAEYINDDAGMHLYMEINLFDTAVNVKMNAPFGNEWTFLEEEQMEIGNIQYYQCEDEYKAFFVNGNCYYGISCNSSLQDLKKVVESMR